MRTHSRLAVALPLLVTFFVGCGTPPAPGPTCGAAGRLGQTDCSGNTCNAGQYCDDTGFPTCTPGCTSDTNCGPAEFCARAVGSAIGACQSCPVCGNGSCESGENSTSCARDCTGGPVCGDALCSVGETCPADCSSTMCGDGFCQAGETRASCPVDCTTAPTCGNGACEVGETPASCPLDCTVGPVCGDGVCNGAESPASCPGDCMDTSLASCLDHCDSYNFFECFAPGGLQACRDACNAATMADREQFDACAGTATVSCDLSCLDYL